MFINFLDTEGFEFLINSNHLVSVQQIDDLDIFKASFSNGEKCFINPEIYKKIKYKFLGVF